MSFTIDPQAVVQLAEASGDADPSRADTAPQSLGDLDIGAPFPDAKQQGAGDGRRELSQGASETSTERCRVEEFLDPFQRVVVHLDT